MDSHGLYPISVLLLWIKDYKRMSTHPGLSDVIPVDDLQLAVVRWDVDSL